MAQTVSYLTLLTLVVLTCCISQGQSDPTPLALMKNYPITQPADTYAYYQLTFNTTKRLLLLSLDLNSTIYTNLYLSVHPSQSSQEYFTHPDDTHSTQECDQSSFETCIIRFDQYLNNDRALEVTVYFSIYSYEQVSYEIWAVVDDIYSLDITSKYRLDFSTYESGMMQLDGSQMEGWEQVVMVMTYNTTGQVGMFKIEAAVDEMPNSEGCCKEVRYGQTVGAFNKVLVLPVIKKDQSYYILIEGEKGTKFSLCFYDSHPSAPSLAMNSTLTYLTFSNLTYTAASPFVNLELPLYITLDAFSGYGIFTVNYCSGQLTTSFQNMNGQNEEIVISPAQRSQCKSSMMEQGKMGLLVETLIVDIIKVELEFGYQIALYEGEHSSPLRLKELKYGTFTDQEERLYPIQIINENQDISVRFMQLDSSEKEDDQLVFEVQQCKRKRNKFSCFSLINNNGMEAGDLTFTPQPNHEYKLSVTRPYPPLNQSTPLQYLLQLEYQYESTSSIAPFRVYLESVSQNQYNFYTINLTQVADQQKIKIVDNTQLILLVKEINGDIYTLVSQTVPQPTYEKYLQGDNVNKIEFSWSGRVQLLVNSSIEVIYVSVKGNSESLYNLQYTLDVDADIPAKYLRLVDGSQMNFVLTKSQPYQLFSFTSHIIPYRILITNSPTCIRMGSTLPLDKTCQTSIPESFTDKVLYFNVTNDNLRNYKFSVYVNSGEYTLTEKDSVLFGCEDECYQIVLVQLQQGGNVIHEGRGQIYEVGHPENLAYNSFLPLTCSQYPCAKRINATLPYGGAMSIFLETANIKELDGRTIPVTFGGEPKKYVFTLLPWTEIGSVLIYSQALQLQVYYNVVNLQEEETNIRSYSFPTPKVHDRHISSNPLRRTMLVPLDEALLEVRGCRQTSTYCLICLSVYPNTTNQYSLEYLDSGLGFISQNAFSYYFPLNVVYNMEESFSMSYFTHRRSQDELFSEQGYRVHLEPLSNCHPRLFMGEGNLQKPHYGDVIAMYQYGWINFTVLAEEDCKYHISMTNSLYLMVSQEKYYTLELENNSVTVLYRSEYSEVRQFVVEVASRSLYQEISYIVANKIDEADSTGYIVATENQADYKAYGSELSIKEDTFFNLYLITIVASPSNSSSGIDLLIHHGEPIILTRNREYHRTLPAHSILSFRIYTSGSIALFAATSATSIDLTVNKNYNHTAVKHAYLSTVSYPWMFLNSTDSSLVAYDITIRNEEDEDTSMTVLFEENDLLSWQKLYQDMVLYDAFTFPNEKNCYYFETEMLVGVPKITVDFVVGKNQSDVLSSKGITFDLQYSVTINEDVVKATLTKISSRPIAYRLEAEYVGGQNYTLCYHTPSASAMGLEYYILLTDLEMVHLLEDRTQVQSSFNQYDMYELVQEGYNQLIMLEVTSCLGGQNNKKLVGSSSFVDARLGRYTDLVNYHKTRTTTYAQLSVAEGYYYIGVQDSPNAESDEYSNSYAIRYQNISSEEAMLPSMWELQDSQIVKIYKSGENESVYNVEMPQVDNINDEVSQTNISIIYTLAFLPSTNDSAIPPLDMTIRCPSYFNTPYPAKAQSDISINQLTFTYDNLSHFNNQRETPIFTFPSLPTSFNVSGKVQLKVDSQQFAFYYQNSQMRLDQLPKSGMSPGVIFAIILMVLLLVILLVMGIFKYLKVSKERMEERQVNMSNFHSDTPSAPVEMNSWKKEGSKAINKPGKYGELVDELN